MAENKTPSLLEPESRGGENASDGFGFQDAFLVSQIPCWLAWDGFIGLTSESIGDVEVKIYSPGYGGTIEMIEVKDYILTPAKFWDEIERFYNVDQGSPNTFYWFRLVAPDVSRDIKPLLNGLRRIQGPYSFYPEDSGVIQHSLDDFYDTVTKANKPHQYAKFLFERVLIDVGHGTSRGYGEAVFVQNLEEYLPDPPLSRQVKSAIYSALLNLVSSRNKIITRKKIEETIRLHIPSDQRPAFEPVNLHTIYQKTERVDNKLVLNWVEFFGGNARNYPEADVWNKNMVNQLIGARKFILNHRHTRQIRLTGSRRLSGAIAIGTIFSATSGFSIEMEHRGVWWYTNDHAVEPIKSLEIVQPQGQNENLIVSIGIPNNIHQAIERYSQSKGISHFPMLNISYVASVKNAQQANSIVAQTKTAILEAISCTGATKIHLFCAVPSFIALLLGHRLNATATIQCYEYIGSNAYIPTCLLST